MFERYTEKARRVIFFARYEASQYGSKTIETEHLLLGLFREDPALTRKFISEKGGVQSMRDEIESQIMRGERISASVEVPLSAECKRILNMAGEEAERLGVKHVGVLTGRVVSPDRHVGDFTDLRSGLGGDLRYRSIVVQSHHGGEALTGDVGSV